MRNMVNVAVRKARIDYVQNQFNLYQRNPKRFGKNIKDILLSKDSNQNFDNILDDYKKAIPRNKLPDSINTYDATIGKKMDKQFDATNLNLHKNQNENVVPLDKFLMVTMEQLDEEIKNIAVHKSSGIHNLSSYVVKMCFKV